MNFLTKGEKMKKYILSISFTILSLLNVFVFSPAPVLAVGVCGSTNSLVQDPRTQLCVNPAERRNAADIITRIINYLLVFAALIAILFIVLGGYKYITSGGNQEMATAGQKSVVNAIIGLVIIILSYVIVSVVNNTLANENGSFLSRIFG